MVLVNTTRFGKLEIGADRVIRFPEGLPGFASQKQFVMLEHRHDSPFLWLQAVGLPQLAFVMVDPWLVKADYLENLSPSDRALLPEPDRSRILMLAFVSFRDGAATPMTVNLLAPVVIDGRQRVGRQTILAGSGYSHRHPLLVEAAAGEGGATGRGGP